MTQADNPNRLLERHLAHWLQAYGADLGIPHGQSRDPEKVPPETESLPLASDQDFSKPDAPTLPSGTHDTAHRTKASEGSSDTETQAPAARPRKSADTENCHESAQKASSDAGTTPDSESALHPTNQPEDPLNKVVKSLRQLRSEVHDCTRCQLHESRQTTVFGEGNPQARVMFIGEAPGAREDQTGRPFVGAAGQLLDRILSGAMGLDRKDVFIANVNKCRPPGNRAPEASEVAACLPYLRQQVELVQPEVLVCLGRTSAQNLLGSTESTGVMRRKRHEYCGIPVIVTWHPAYLLREPSRKRETWEDIKQVNKLLGLPDVPTRQS